MNKRPHRQLCLGLLCACAYVFGVLAVTSARAADFARVLLVADRGVGAGAQAALGSAIAADAELLDSREYNRMTRSRGLTAASPRALKTIAPDLHADLIVVAKKSGSKLLVAYHDGRTGELLRKERFAASARRGAAAKRLQARLSDSVRSMLASLGRGRDSGPGPTPPIGRAEPEAELDPEPPADLEPVSPAAAERDEPEAFSTDAALPEDAYENDDQAEDEPVEEEEPEQHAMFFEVSAGVGGAMRDSALPTRLGVRDLSTGLFPGASLGLRIGMPLGSHWLLYASADYRTSLGLRGVESQAETEMKTPLRSHGVGFGVSPGYRFGDENSASLHVHFGYYFRGLRPVAQLALPNISWHAAVIRPELYIPISEGAVTLRLAPELLLVAGLHTSLVDESGLARTGTGLGAEASVDVRVAEPVLVRIEYRESHVSLNTAWALRFTDVDRFGAVRVVLRY